jgi:hypothetical protein
MGCLFATGVADISAEKIRQIYFHHAHSRTLVSCRPAATSWFPHWLHDTLCPLDTRVNQFVRAWASLRSPEPAQYHVRFVFAIAIVPGAPTRFAFFANVWASAQTPFYDFSVWTDKKRVEKLRYMHRNPVKRGLAPAPPRNEEWRWSSYPFYLLDEPGPVWVNEGWGKISFRAPAA